MISREYNKRVSLFEVTTTSNQFGGNTPTETILFTSWAKLSTKSAGYKSTDFGLDTFENPVIFYVRHRNDFKYQGRTLFISYKNEKYIIKGIRKINQADVELEIFTQKLEHNLG